MFLLLVLESIFFFFWPITPASLFLEDDEIRICNASPEHYEKIHRYLAFLTPEVRFSIRGITIEETDSEDYWGKCNRLRKIRIKSSALLYKPSNIWHEGAHAHHYYLDAIWSGFSSEWKSINGAKIFPNDAEEEYEEDIAYWVQHCYLASTGLYGFWDLNIFLLIFKNASYLDKEGCKQKLNLLLKYKFIDSAVYEKIRNAYPVIFK